MISDPSKVPHDLADRTEYLKSLFIHFNEIEPHLEYDYLIRGWFGSGTLSILYGPSNSGKTFIAVDLAAHVASGTQWWGNKVRSGTVIYVAGEGSSGIHNRFAAVKQKKKMPQSGEGLYLLPTCLDLFGPEDAAALCYSMPVDNAALIIVDTMARSMGSGDENSARDVAKFVRNCDIIRERTGAHVLIVHHSGKNVDAGARGSSALRAAADTEILVSNQKISCTKQRDLEVPLPLYFAIKSVELGRDEDNQPVTSAVVIQADSPVSKVEQFTKREKIALKALDMVLSQDGTVKSGTHFPQNHKVVESTKWKEQCRVTGLTKSQATQDTKRKAFIRAKNGLIAKSAIGCFEEFVWKL